MNYLSLIDIFGVEFKQQISLHVKSQKSVIGGIASLLILVASLGYFSYIINEWVQYSLLPKSSNTMQVDDSSELIYNEDEALFEFFYWKYSSHQIDPFNYSLAKYLRQISLINYNIIQQNISYFPIIFLLPQEFTLLMANHKKHFLFYR